MPMYLLGDRRHFGAGELTYGIPRHQSDFTVQPGIVNAAVANDRLTKLTKTAFMRAIANRSFYLRLSQRFGKKAVREAEIGLMHISLSQQFLTDLSSKPQRHITDVRLSLLACRLRIRVQGASCF